MSVLNAAGCEVKTQDYVDGQMKLTAGFTMQASATGPEQFRDLNDKEWQSLDRIYHHGIQARQEIQEVSRNGLVNYLQQVWYDRYAPLVGVLARVDEQPLEPVLAQVESFQHKVIDNVGNLRHLWHEATGQLLELQSLFEQVRWHDPWVKEVEEVPGAPDTTEYYLAADALLPYVCCENNHGPCLRMDRDHVDVESFRMPVAKEHVKKIEEDLAKYR